MHAVVVVASGSDLDGHRRVRHRTAPRASPHAAAIRREEPEVGPRVLRFQALALRGDSHLILVSWRQRGARRSRRGRRQWLRPRARPRVREGHGRRGTRGRYLYVLLLRPWSYRRRVRGGQVHVGEGPGHVPKLKHARKENIWYGRRDA